MLNCEEQGRRDGWGHLFAGEIKDISRVQVVEGLVGPWEGCWILS